MSFKCKHCTHSQVHRIQDKTFYYCPIRKNYPSPLFISAWGCDKFEDTQLKLEYEEKEHGNKKK